MSKTLTSFDLPDSSVWQGWTVPMVEIFETVEGEGMAQGFPTVFVRTFHCNLRCTWCDTPYSYAPAKPEYESTIEDICETIAGYSARHICFTGGEPLIHREKSAALLVGMARLPYIEDIHIETNGAIDLKPFSELRDRHPELKEKMRFVMDYKLPGSGENKKMLHDNFTCLEKQDELKFVIADDDDFEFTCETLQKHPTRAQILLSPVWESMHPQTLVEKMLKKPLPLAKLSLQMHKMIWHPDQRGV